MIRFVVVTLLSCAWCAGLAHAGEVDEAIKASTSAQQAARQSQERVDRIAGQIQALYREQQDARARELQMSAYAVQLEKQAEAEEQKRDAVAQQISGIDETEANLLPLVERMVADLQLFVGKDMPFQRELRERRVTELQALLDDPERSAADKFRRVLDVYRSEVDYGYSLGTEQTKLSISGRDRDVTLVRIGRLALYFLTTDAQRAGYWNAEKGGWRDLPDDSIPQVQRALQVASGEIPPELLVVPVQVPE